MDPKNGRKEGPRDEIPVDSIGNSLGNSLGLLRPQGFQIEIASDLGIPRDSYGDAREIQGPRDPFSRDSQGIPREFRRKFLGLSYGIPTDLREFLGNPWEIPKGFLSFLQTPTNS